MNGGRTDAGTDINPNNAMFQIYPDVKSISNSEILFNQTCQYISGSYNYDVANNGLNADLKYGLPFRFCFLPVVINNYDYQFNDPFICYQTSNDKPLFESIPNTLKNDYGSYWSGVKIQSTGINYNITYRLAGTYTGSRSLEFRVLFCRNNPCEIIFTSNSLTAPFPPGNAIDRTVSTTTSLLNEGDIIYPLIIWNSIDPVFYRVEKMQLNSLSYFNVIPQNI